MTAPAAGLSKKAGPGFGKSGRPPNDAVRERVRIYRAAGPLILERGVRGTTIAAVARAAFLSPGGIYHYFASKRQLVLYGLEPEALSRACTDASKHLHEALASRPAAPLARIIELFTEKNMQMLEFVRPALQAAVELGRPEVRARLSAGILNDADALVAALRRLYPDLMTAEAEGLADAIRRTMFGLAVDDRVTKRDAERQLEWLFQRLIPQLARARTLSAI